MQEFGPSPALRKFVFPPSRGHQSNSLVENSIITPNWRWIIIEFTTWEMLTGFDATSVTLNTQCSEHCNLALTFGGSNCDGLVRIREGCIQIFHMSDVRKHLFLALPTFNLRASEVCQHLEISTGLTHHHLAGV